MYILTIGGLLALALHVSAQNSTTSSSSTPFPTPTGPFPSLISDTKLGDVYEITMRNPDDSQYTTQSVGSVEPAMQSIYNMPLTTAVVWAWSTQGEVHEEVRKDPNGTVYTTTITRTAEEWFAGDPATVEVATASTSST